MRFILVLAVLVLAISVLRFLYARLLAAGQATRGPHRRTPASGAVEAIIRCRHCGTYFPASEAVAGESGTVFCSEDHHHRHIAAH